MAKDKPLEDSKSFSGQVFDNKIPSLDGGSQAVNRKIANNALNPKKSDLEWEKYVEQKGTDGLFEGRS